MVDLMEPFAMDTDDALDPEHLRLQRISSAVPGTDEADQHFSQQHADQLREVLYRQARKLPQSERRERIRHFMIRNVPFKPTRSSPYCQRHDPAVMCRKPPDAVTLESVQKELDVLSLEDQEIIRDIWSVFGAASGPVRTTLIKGLMTQCCLPQLSLASTLVSKFLQVDFITFLPPELAFQILGLLDTASLCAAAQVSRKWKLLADDDSVWARMCEQHIDRKCDKCGWGLPSMEKKRLQESIRRNQIRAISRGMNVWMPNITPVSTPPVHVANAIDPVRLTTNTNTEDLSSSSCGPPSRTSTHDLSMSEPSLKANGKRSACQLDPSREDLMSSPYKRSRAEPTSYFDIQSSASWKHVYRDRFKIGTNWKQGRYNLRTISAHEEGVTCLAFDEATLITGSYDCTIKIWDLLTGNLIRTLIGHGDRIRALQFDVNKLISGSMDGEVKIWNWKTGKCVCTYAAHEGGVIGLHYDGDLMASGSADETIKIWSFKTRDQFILKGHHGWVNSVKLHVKSNTLFSAGDDCTVKMWDLESRSCVQTFVGHVGQVQQVLILPPEFEPNDSFIQSMEGHLTPPDDEPMASIPVDHHQHPIEYSHLSSKTAKLSILHHRRPTDSTDPISQRPKYILSASLDNTIALWLVETGQCLMKFFGHVEGVWALDADKLRVVTGAQDRTVKIWDARKGRCERTFAGGNGHQASVSCIGLGDDKVISGSDDGEVKIWSFGSEVYMGDRCKEKSSERLNKRTGKEDQGLST